MRAAETKTLVEIDFSPKRVGEWSRMGQCFGILVKHWFLIVAAILEGLGWLVVWLAILGIVFPSKACND